MDTRNFTFLYSGKIYIVFDTGLLVNKKYKMVILLERILQK
jgi:hypothetical protein